MIPINRIIGFRDALICCFFFIYERYSTKKIWAAYVPWISTYVEFGAIWKYKVFIPPVWTMRCWNKKLYPSCVARNLSDAYSFMVTVFSVCILLFHRFSVTQFSPFDEKWTLTSFLFFYRSLKFCVWLRFWAKGADFRRPKLRNWTVSWC